MTRYFINRFLADFYALVENLKNKVHRVYIEKDRILIINKAIFYLYSVKRYFILIPGFLLILLLIHILF